LPPTAAGGVAHSSGQLERSNSSDKTSNAEKIDLLHSVTLKCLDGAYQRPTILT
jgi:hypothetical protein